MMSTKAVLLIITGIIAVAGTFAVFHKLVKRYDREKRKQEFHQLLEEKRYFKGITYEMNWLFGEGRNSKVLDVAKKEAEEFRDSEKQAAYLYSYFGLRINSETLGHIVNCYLWVRAADRICDSHPEFEEFRDGVYPYNWKVKASFFEKEKYYEREWLFEISDFLDNTDALKKKVLNFYDSLDSEATVAEAVESTEQKVE